MAKKSPTAFSVDWFKRNGFIYSKTEQMIPHCFIKRDTFGFGDFLVAKIGWGTALIQVTSGGGSGNSNALARERKARAIPELATWLACGNRFILHNWKMLGPRGNKVPTLIEKEITLADLTSQESPLVR